MTGKRFSLCTLLMHLVPPPNPNYDIGKGYVEVGLVGGNEVTLSDDPSAQKTVGETKSHKAGGQIDKARCSSLSLCGNGKRPHLFA